MKPFFKSCQFWGSIVGMIASGLKLRQGIHDGNNDAIYSATVELSGLFALWKARRTLENKMP